MPMHTIRLAGFAAAILCIGASMAYAGGDPDDYDPRRHYKPGWQLEEGHTLNSYVFDAWNLRTQRGVKMCDPVFGTWKPTKQIISKSIEGYENHPRVKKLIATAGRSTSSTLPTLEKGTVILNNGAQFEFDPRSPTANTYRLIGKHVVSDYNTPKQVRYFVRFNSVKFCKNSKTCPEEQMQCAYELYITHAKGIGRNVSFAFYEDVYLMERVE